MENMTSELANSWWMYAIAIFVFVFVLGASLLFIFKSYRDAKRINMDKKYLKQAIISSVIFSVLPSISILIGVITLSGALGIPLPWIRLSVIGAIHYEMSAVKAAYADAALLENLTRIQFVTIVTVMTLGILTGPIYCLIGFKAYDKKIVSKAKTSPEVEVDENGKEIGKKKTFGPILFDAAFIAMIGSFLAEDIAKVKNIGTGASPIDSYTPIIVIAVSFLSMFIFDLIEKKTKAKWLGNFALGFSMLIAMAVAVIIG